MPDNVSPPDTVPTETILDRVTDGLFGLDPDWAFTYVNERARATICDAMGEDLTAEELVGRDIWEAIPELEETTFADHYREAMRTQERMVFEDYYDPLDTWFEVRVYPSESGLSVYFRDVTQSRRRREELRTRASILREIHEVIADHDASFEDQVTDLLTIGQRVLGTAFGTLSRVRGEEYVFEVVLAPDDAIEAGDVVDLSATNCERVVLSEERLVVENIPEDEPDLATRAGNTEWGISCYLGTPVIVDEEVYGTFCFYDTEVRAEEFTEWEVTLVDLMGRWVSVALEQRLVERRLRKQNDRLKEFATLVSHDLRNPLNVAEGWLEMAREEGDDDALDRVADSHQRMHEIIEDVLTMVRAGRDVESTDPVDLESAATDAWAQVTTDGATLTVAETVTLRADRSRLKQLFENLFRNSVEHGSTEDDAPLAVTVGRLDDGFYVEDDGVGIPPADRDRVLQHGYTTGDGGTGVGLGVVDDIATAHGWSVDVVEGETGGARFEFTGVAFDEE